MFLVQALLHAVHILRHGQIVQAEDHIEGHPWLAGPTTNGHGMKPWILGWDFLNGRGFNDSSISEIGEANYWAFQAKLEVPRIGPSKA